MSDEQERLEERDRAAAEESRAAELVEQERLAAEEERLAAENATLDEPGGELPTEVSVSDLEAQTEAGFAGTKVDPTPDENYTVPGVTEGRPTPETDADAARVARERRTELGRGSREQELANTGDVAPSEADNTV